MFDVDHEEESLAIGAPDRELANLAGATLDFERHGERIEQHGHRLLEGDAVLPAIRLGLLLVPLRVQSFVAYTVMTL